MDTLAQDYYEAYIYYYAPEHNKCTGWILHVELLDCHDFDEEDLGLCENEIDDIEGLSSVCVAGLHRLELQVMVEHDDDGIQDIEYSVIQDKILVSGGEFTDFVDMNRSKGDSLDREIERLKRSL